jgi:hypothetical protein
LFSTTSQLRFAKKASSFPTFRWVKTANHRILNEI